MLFLAEECKSLCTFIRSNRWPRMVKYRTDRLLCISCVDVDLLEEEEEELEYW